MIQKEVLLTRLQKLVIDYIQYAITAVNKHMRTYNLQRLVLWIMVLLLPVVFLLFAFNIITLYSGFAMCIAVGYIVLAGVLIMLNYER
ncbi:MAG: hypothetical protein ABIN95_10930 [Mucilaginibacter sp.]